MTVRKISVGLLVVLMAMGAFVGYVQAEGFTVDNEFSSKYMWRGFDLFDDHGAWFASTDIDLSEALGEGWGLNVWGAQPIGSGNEEVKELDYTVSFSNTVNDGEMDELEYTVGWTYYDLYEANKKSDAQEITLALTWPNALKCGEVPLVPSLFIAQHWPDAGEKGTFYILGLDQEVTVEGCPYPLNLHADLTYNDSASAHPVTGSAPDSDFSHATIGISTDVEVMGVAITPYVNFQKSMDDSVNKEDELWAGFSTSITF